MNLEDIHAVIESAKARGTSSLERFARDRLPDATDAQVDDAVDLVVEILDSLPVLLARTHQAAEDRGLERLVEPILDRANSYILRPVDLIPEMTQGLAGLVDDAYMVLRTLQALDRGPRPLLDWQLDEPVSFLGRLLGPEISKRLDLLAAETVESAETHFAALWEAMSAEA